MNIIKIKLYSALLATFACSLLNRCDIFTVSLKHTKRFKTSIYSCKKSSHIHNSLRSTGLKKTYFQKTWLWSS